MKKYNYEYIQSSLRATDKPSDDYADELQVGGYRILKECQSTLFYDTIDIVGRQESIASGFIDEGHLENQAYLHSLDVLNSLQKNAYNFVELGTGYGAPSLAFAGFIDNTDMFSNIKNYNIIGIEGERNHYEWTKRILTEQIKGNVKIVNGAVTTYDGYINFQQGNSANDYGQSIGSGESVECYRLDTLLKQNNISTVDFLHIDIQGEELNVINDSIHLFNKINFMYIGTHSSHIHYSILNILNQSNIFNIIFNMPINETTEFPEYGIVKPYPYMDGLIFCQNKNLI